MPSYAPAEREHLKAVAAEPTTANQDNVRICILALTLIATLPLWALALATYIVTRAVPDAVLTAREPTWRIIVRSAIPGETAAGLAAVVITAFAVPVLGLGLVETLGFLGVATLALRATVMGGGGLVTGVVLLVTWLAIGALATVFITGPGALPQRSAGAAVAPVRTFATRG